MRDLIAGVFAALALCGFVVSLCRCVLDFGVVFRTVIGGGQGWSVAYP